MALNNQQILSLNEKFKQHMQNKILNGPRTIEEIDRLTALRFYVEQVSGVNYIVTPRSNMERFNLSAIYGSTEKEIMNDIDLVVALVGELYKIGGSDAICRAIETYLEKGNDLFDHWL